MVKEKLQSIKINAKNAMFISDIHFGARSASEEWQDNMRGYFQEWFIPFLSKYINSLDDPTSFCLFVLGDVYDNRKSIDIDVNNLAIDIFEEISKICKVYVINGNHDLSKRTNAGTTSLRSLGIIPNICIITDPMILKMYNAKKHLADILAIPYLGAFDAENAVLNDYAKNVQYAFMHTDITKMKYDNGMTIVGGVNADVFDGKIYSGHIHKRQENKNVVYVGSPYQLTRGDIGNQKGIYTIDFETGTTEFTENNYSPIFHTIRVLDFLELGASERAEFLNNNYNYFLITDEELAGFKRKSDLYDIGQGTKAKQIKIIVQHSKQTAEDIGDYKELSLSELICKSINTMELPDDAKERLTKMGLEYLRAAESEMSNE